MNRREREKTTVPGEMLFPDPGRVLWARLLDTDGATVGAVWAVVDPTQSPRAGMVVRKGADLDGEMQGALGSYLLTVDGVPDRDWHPHLMLAYLASVFSGVGQDWRLDTAPEVDASVSAVRWSVNA